MSSVTPVRHQSRTPKRVTPPVAPPIDTAAIIEMLRAKAETVLGALNGVTLSGFQVGSLGNFPYVWQNPSNPLQFNYLTYEWINSHLAANTTPVALDELFTDQYLQALSAVRYNLSTADQERLNAAQAAATQQQAALLNQWLASYQKFPALTSTGEPIDAVVSTIATTWAVPATTLQDMASADDLSQLLNNMPASGVPILPMLAQWLNAMNSSIALQNATTMNPSYLQKALTAVSHPSASNGGLLTDNADGQLRPAYAMAASSQVSDIENSLKGTSHVTVDMSVVRSSASEFTVSAGGQTQFSVPVDDFISVDVSASASYFKDTIATSSNTVNVSMSFSGVTLVNFGPVPFDLSTFQNWFWMDPIRQAIANGSKDVTGFEFSHDPGIDFSSSGPFGYLQGVAIANYPTITIQVTSSDYEKIHTTFQSQIDVNVSFIGISLASGSASSYSNVTSIDASTQTVTITLNPPPDLIAGTVADSTGWILGVQTEYPAATN